MEKQQIDVQIVSGAVDALPDDQKEQILSVIRTMFDNYPGLLDLANIGKKPVSVCQPGRAHDIST